MNKLLLDAFRNMTSCCFLSFCYFFVLFCFFNRSFVFLFSHSFLLSLIVLWSLINSSLKSSLVIVVIVIVVVVDSVINTTKMSTSRTHILLSFVVRQKALDWLIDSCIVTRNSSSLSSPVRRRYCCCYYSIARTPSYSNKLKD